MHQENTLQFWTTAEEDECPSNYEHSLWIDACVRGKSSAAATFVAIVHMLISAGITM